MCFCWFFFFIVSLSCSCLIINTYKLKDTRSTLFRVNLRSVLSESLAHTHKKKKKKKNHFPSWIVIGCSDADVTKLLWAAIIERGEGEGKTCLDSAIFHIQVYWSISPQKRGGREGEREGGREGEREREREREREFSQNSFSHLMLLLVALMLIWPH